MKYATVTFIIVAVIILVVAKRYLDSHQSEIKIENEQPTIYRYKAKSSIMTPSEGEFFKMLTEAVGDRYYVFPQVRLSALLDEHIVGQSYEGARKHVNQKSIDYVLCDKETLKPAYAVELDDVSHEREDRISRDKEVARILQEARIALVRFEDYRQLTSDDIVQGFLDVHKF